jgi:hypothetical protein
MQVKSSLASVWAMIVLHISPKNRQQNQIRQIGGLLQTKKLLNSKGNDQQKADTTYRTGNMCKPSSDKELIGKIHKKLNSKRTNNLN